MSELDSIAAVAPNSGTLRGRRMIAGGRRNLRKALFQSALADSVRNPTLKPAAQRLRDKGKLHKVVIIAIAKWLVAIAILKSRQKWSA